MAEKKILYRIARDGLITHLESEISALLNQGYILSGSLVTIDSLYCQPMIYYPPITTHDIKLDKAPTDNGLPALDNLCKQYNDGDINISSLVCRAWNTALGLGREGG